MNKLKLEIESLAVDSFETAAAGRAEGTVHAHLFATRGNPNTCNVGCCNTCVDCPPAPTVAATCAC